MISKNKAKFIKSLQLKKYRKAEGAFVVEGGKSVLELLKSGFQIREVYVTPSFFDANEALLKQYADRLLIATEKELESAGSLKSNNAALAVASLPAEQPPAFDKRDFLLALDDVRDPGNLGTIVRIADWYGIYQLLCSEETTDAFAPKVVQACMGSLTRVKVSYGNLKSLISSSGLPVYGAVLNGKSVHEEHFAAQGIILMGNESNGISKELLTLVDHPVTIPGLGGAESLNVAVATAVICDNMRRSRNG